MSDAVQIIRPDRDFLRRLVASGGEDLKKCFQCATCSVVCELSDARRPFPRKEMLWAQWGLRERLVSDADIWRCHQCNDCSTQCPRGARPGDVMAAIRREAIVHFACPRFMARWAMNPRLLPLLLLVPVVLIGLCLLVAQVAGPPAAGDRIVFAYWNQLPQWILIVFFGAFALLDLVALGVGIGRFLRALGTADPRPPLRGLFASTATVAASILRHDEFGRCAELQTRRTAHMAVLLGFVTLVAVDAWVLLARFNPLLPDALVYPFGFWSPWKILGNLGGLAILAGVLMMVWDRMKRVRPGTWFDQLFLGMILLVVLSGFATEALHYARIDILRQAVYVAHLVPVFLLVVFLPYSKFAHMIYRTLALVWVERRRAGEAHGDA